MTWMVERRQGGIHVLGTDLSCVAALKLAASLLVTALFRRKAAGTDEPYTRALLSMRD